MIKTRYWLTLLLLAAILAGCASFSASSQAQDAGRLVIYSGRSESLVAPIIEQFSQASGIKVEVRYGNTSELAATLLEEGKNSPADVFYAQDPGGLGAVANAGLLAELPNETLDKVESRFRSAQGLWVGISGRARVVVYNTQLLKAEDLPADLFGFTEPRWKGKIGWAPTNASFQAMVTAMRQMWGEEKTRQWLVGILANQPVVYDGNTAVVAAVGSGEIEVGFVNHYYLYRFLREQGNSFPARNHFMNNGGPDSLVMVSGIGRLATSKNEENALKFINFLLSPVAQQYFAGQTYEYPLVAGVQTEADLPPLESLNSAGITVDQLADLEGTLNLLRETGVLP
ncbi:ABC-type Fe3+ transport system, periplasmic component [Bellilinea caldifistulae]|uniref:iron ABC transporter substrate-binding protein n=1 Tax=Bellilinea caldifistulae TaxID=360411 RepID=UPI000780768E|nr:iron ABC transporter substrate-binding protein [Bellilinea caldifistulae]GAP11659.1 ABC-type Fe3+ transport system, periplasmic component [Bellilinea caldifistulae]